MDNGEFQEFQIELEEKVINNIRSFIQKWGAKMKTFTKAQKRVVNSRFEVLEAVVLLIEESTA